jgi:mRNA interferase RelE/StbE
LNKWEVEFLPEAAEDRRKLDGSVRRIVDKAIDKVSTNPLPVEEGGYGKPLGNKDGTDLTGLMKVKLKASGLRIVYQIVREKTAMKIIIIGVRDDSKVYKEADKRWKRIQ